MVPFQIHSLLTFYTSPYQTGVNFHFQHLTGTLLAGFDFIKGSYSIVPDLSVELLGQVMGRSLQARPMVEEVPPKRGNFDFQ